MLSAAAGSPVDINGNGGLLYTKRSGAGTICTVLFLFCALVLPSTGSGEAFAPNDPYFSYGAGSYWYPGEWHLENAGTVVSGKTNNGVDAGLRGAWNLGYTGKGVTIGIIDDGVEGTHEDLKANYSAALSRKFLGGSILGPTGPIYQADNHGTSVAGVAAARGGNGIGGTGAAPYATIADLRLLDDTVVTQDYINAYLWASGVELKDGKYVITSDAQIQVKNHSYGKKYPWTRDDANIAKVMNRSAQNGVIHVWAAGNERGKMDEDSSKNQTHANSNIITVAALGSDGKYASYSNYSSSVFVTAPSNGSGTLGIITTDRSGANLGYNRYSAQNLSGDNGDVFPDTSYCSDFGGTSSATPLVAGIMALGKEANKYMDVRMAQHALVLTSTKVDPNDASAAGGWIMNGAGNWFNPNYGFGKINAGKFVEKVAAIKGVSAQTSYSTPLQTVNETIKYLDAGNAGGTTKQITLTTAQLPAALRQPLEGVQVYLNFTHAKRGDLTAYVTSPYGTTSRLFNSTAHLPAAQQDDTSVTDFGWTFLSNAFWGEDPLGGADKASGKWVITMGDRVNKAAADLGTWNSYGLTLLMGKILFNGAGVITQTENIKARSLSMQNSGDILINPKGYSLEVGEKVEIKAGEMNVNGIVRMNRPEDDEDEGEFVLDGGIVSGAGTIEAPYGFYHVSGTIKPGNSIGTLTIVGDYYQERAAKLLIEVASPTSNDVLAVVGSAYLNGILQTSWLGGRATPAIGTVFGAFLTATDGVYGQFSSLLTNITPTVVFKPRYDIPNQVYLVVQRDYANEVLLPYLNTNQRAVGAMFNSVGNTATGDLDTVLRAIDALPGYSQVANALDQAAPRGSEALFSMGISSTSFQAMNISDRLFDIRRGIRGANLDGVFMKNSSFVREGKDRPVLIASAGPDLAGMLPDPGNERWGIFVKGNAVSGDQRDTSDRTGYNFTSAGATLGMDYRFTDSLALGLLIGYTGSRADVDDYGSKVTMDGYTAGIYGTWYRHGFFVDGQASYGWADYRNSRRIVFTGIDRTASSRPSGRQLTLYGGTGYEFKTDAWMLVPSVSLQYIKLGLDSYTESGAGALNLNVDRQNMESFLGNIGGRAYYTFDTEGAVIMPGIRASYGYEFLRDARGVTSTLAQGSSPFTIELPSAARNTISCGASISMFLKKNGASFQLGYDAQFGSDNYTAHSINGMIRMVF